MNDDRPSSENLPHKSWVDRLSRALLREPKDREQLVDLLRDAQRRDLLDADALGMIESVLQVGEMQVRDIMIPRAQMAVVNRERRPTRSCRSSSNPGIRGFPSPVIIATKLSAFCWPRICYVTVSMGVSHSISAT